ncbi:hypothetical protein ACFOWX_03455 [Sphingorhabdus arenilitoris]|uniref:Protoheme IX farnesyltransferase n=1 Tax=Sphingorhabdus arenilitoris TaxID=1490041 RepID=A0ABV8RGU6_9SPHN
MTDKDSISAPEAITRRSIYDSQDEAQSVGRMSADETRLVRERQDARSRVLGMILLGMCVLFFAITVVKIGFLS